MYKYKVELVNYIGKDQYKVYKKKWYQLPIMWEYIGDFKTREEAVDFIHRCMEVDS